MQRFNHKYVETTLMILVYFFHVSVQPSKPVIYLSGMAIEGVTLTLTCLSIGGYPKQDVNWYRRIVSSVYRLNGSVSFEINNLYDVTNTLTFTPFRADDGVPYICQSSYSDEPRLNETSEHNVSLACRYHNIVLGFQLYIFWPNYDLCNIWSKYCSCGTVFNNFANYVHTILST